MFASLLNQFAEICAATKTAERESQSAVSGLNLEADELRKRIEDQKKRTQYLKDLLARDLVCIIFISTISEEIGTSRRRTPTYRARGTATCRTTSATATGGPGPCGTGCRHGPADRSAQRRARCRAPATQCLLPFCMLIYLLHASHYCLNPAFFKSPLRGTHRADGERTRGVAGAAAGSNCSRTAAEGSKACSSIEGARFVGQGERRCVTVSRLLSCVQRVMND
jgi:hypothetical protein